MPACPTSIPPPSAHRFLPLARLHALRPADANEFRVLPAPRPSLYSTVQYTTRELLSPDVRRTSVASLPRETSLLLTCSCLFRRPQLHGVWCVTTVACSPTDVCAPSCAPSSNEFCATCEQTELQSEAFCSWVAYSLSLRQLPCKSCFEGYQRVEPLARGATRYPSRGTT